MFAKILISNRGEIACRIIRTARRLGVKTVAVYSDADRDALHVEMADEAVHIGASEVAQSYLNGARIIKAALQTGAQAIHPGYGFLSENPEFVDAVTKAGLIFIGPSARSIRAMGLKDAAKALMVQAGVPVVPGSHAVTGMADAGRAAAEVGYPVLVKAAAGGGGRGIRPVQDRAELAEVLPAAQAEARSAFGDGTAYIERAIPRARHIEVQVLADNRGNVVHLFERDCSMQRRRQKLIEEAPAPDLQRSTRVALNDAAVRLARQVGYRNAGTVEFLVDLDENFYFIEMNTRVQVEHPITEAITGVDIVAEQLQVAADGPLSVAQEGVVPTGAAVELRINAEDPANGFAPTPGEVARFDLPGGPGVRVDTWLTQGDRITPFYDSLVAKLVCWGADRAQAYARARQALREFHVEGVASTIQLHRELTDDAELLAGPVHTTWLEQRLG